jgi:uncharacterized repeat protein (TIGR01451 family)
VSYQIGATFQGTSLTNVAEITEDDGDDVDSTPDNDVPTEDDQDEVTIPVDQTYDLALSKSLSSAGPFTQGSTVTYTITVTNEGSLNAANIEVTDRPETGLSYAGSNLPAGVTYNGNDQFTIAALAQGASISFEVSYQIGATFQGTSLTNVAEITEDDGDDVDSTPDNDVPTEDDQDEVTVPVDQTASVDLEKATNGQDADTFEESVIVLVPNIAPTITWTYTITNTGTLDLTNLVVTDDQEGQVCVIPFLAAGATTTCTKSAPAIRGHYTNLGTVVAQPVDVNGNPHGGTVTDSDPSNYVGLFINIDKEGDKEEICAGEEVTFSLTMRMLGGAPGVQFRDISVMDSNLPLALTPNGTYWIGGDDNGNGFLDFGEEFVWGYSLIYDVTTTNTASDVSTVWFLGNNTGLMPMGMDEWTVTVNPDRCASIGDYVWLDSNGNGIQDDGPTGVGGVTVNLLDGNGNFIRSTTTDGTGFYEFTGLIPGDYMVEFVLPTGNVFAPQNQGDDALDSDADPITGRSQVITLVNGQSDPTIDAGIYPFLDLELDKTFVSAELQGNGTYNVTYTITVANAGGPGQYDLTDTPGFDDDITINSANYTSNAPGNAGSALAGNGPWTLADDQPIVAFATHTYTLVVNVSMNLNDGQGDNTYTACGATTGTPQPGEGLYNLVALDTNNDGTPEATADDCGDLPVLEVNKTFVSAIRTAQGAYTVTYNITVTSGAGAGQYDLTDTPGFDDDIIPTSASYTSNAPGNAAGALAGAGPWVLANDQLIAANTVHTYTLTVNVLYDLEDEVGDNVYTACGANGEQPQPGEGLFNRVAVDTNNDGIPEDTAEDCGDLPLIDLELDKSVNNSFPPIGTQVTFTVVVTNAGQNTATGVIVTDQLPSGFTYAGHAGGTYNPNTGAWNIGTMLPGAVVTLQITAIVNATGDYVNYAEVTFANEDDIDSTPDNGVDTNGNDICADDPDDEDDGDCAEVFPQPTVDLELDKEVSNATPNIFEEIEFTVTITNQGPSTATSVIVFDNLPSGFTYVSHTTTQGDWHPALAHWNIGTLAPGQTEVLAIRVTVNATGNYRNEAYVLTCNEYDIDSTPGNEPDTNGNGECDDDPADEDDGDCATVIPNLPIDIELDKSVSPTAVNVGDVVTFTLDVLNRGPGTATGVVVRDDVPSGYTGIAAISGGGVYNPTNNTIIWNIPSLAPGASVQFTFQAQVLSAGNYVNSAEVIAHNEVDVDSTPGNGVDTNGNGNCIDDAGDEDDGDCATVIVNPCEITAVINEIICNDNGTGLDPSDDTFTVLVTVTGTSTSGTWTSNAPNSGVYNIGTQVALGPFPISQFGAGNSVIFNVFDTNIPGCIDRIEFTVPQPCSNQCLLSIGQTAPVCDPGADPFSPADDTFTFLLVVNAANGGSPNGWTAFVNGQVAATGNYGIAGVPFGPFLISGGQVCVTIIDNDDPNCTEVVCITPPAPCTPDIECLIQVTPANVVCNDNGTPTNPNDDTYTFQVVVNRVGLGGTGFGWQSNDPLHPNGDYGVAYTFGPYPISQGNRVIRFNDFLFPDCEQVITVTAPQPCSNQCAVTANLISVTCNDNGTPSNPNDDVFFVAFTVTGNNGGPNWTATASNAGASFNVPATAYGTTVTVGPFPISGGNVSIIANAATPGCVSSLTANAPASCSPICAITANVVVNAECNDNGTPGISGDDFYEFSVLVTGNNTGNNGWRAVINGTLFTGAYGQVVQIGGLPIVPGQTSITVLFTDADNSSCQTQITVATPPETCSDQCSITAYVVSTTCNNNGTPVDPSDDTYTVVIEILGNNNNTTWTAVGPGGVSQSGTYPGIAVFDGYSISGGDRQFQIWDNGDPQVCRVTVTAQAPPTCAVCQIDAQALNIQCDDNGTPEADDDTYSFDVLVTGFNTSPLGWRQLHPIFGVTQPQNFGQYGTLEHYTGIPIGMDTTLIIADRGSAACIFNLTVQSPPACPYCVIEAEVSDIVCDDNGTGTNADDTFRFNVTVTGLNTAGTWQGTANGTPISGPYNQPVTLSGFPIAGGALAVIIHDADEEACTTGLFTVTPPAPCSDIPPCDITVVVDSVLCNNMGTLNPLDDTYSFYLLLGGQGLMGTGWTASNGLTGTFGVGAIYSGFPVGQNANFTIVANITNGCAAAVFVSSPPPCSGCLLEAELLGTVCNDNGTPFDSSDDTFTVSVRATSIGGNTGYLVYDGISPTPTFGVYGGPPVLLGAYNVASVTIVLVDVVNPSCRDTIIVTNPCGPAPCIINADAQNIVCSDNGTPGNPTDDTFTFGFRVTGSNTGSGWVATGGVNTTGSYGQTVVFGPFPISGGQICITVADIDDPNCTDVICITPPPACSGDCSIAATATNIVCDDNGTEDPIDDTFTFDLSVSGINVGASTGWNTVGDIVANGIYPATVTLGPFLHSDGALTFTVRDNIGDCSVELTVEPPTDVIIDCPDDVSELTFDRNVQVVTGALTATDAVLAAGDSLCWLPDNLTPAGARRYDLLRFKTDDNIADGEVYTFVLLSQMALNNAPAPLPNPMVDGAGAIFEGEYDFSNPCCNVLTAADAPFAGLYNPTFNAADLGLAGYTAVQQMSLRLKPGQEYTILTTTWAPGTLGNYAWAMYSYDALPLLQATGNMAPIAGVTAPVTYDLICTDVDSILNNTTYTGEPEVTGTCGLDFVGYEDIVTGGGCEDQLIITRIFTAQGLKFPLDSCDQQITIRKAVLADVVWPRLSAMYPCEAVFLTDANDNPHPTLTGYPFVMTAFGAVDLNTDYCNLSAAYVDTRVSTCANAYEVHRLWTVTDECDPTATATFTQILKVGDFEGPIVECPIFEHYCPVIQDSIMIFATDPFECSATILVPMPEVTDNCSDNWSVTTHIVNAQGDVLYTILPGAARTVTGVGIGDYVFRFIVTDECGNTTVKECAFRVADTQEPVAICQGAINLSLGAQGLARLYTTSVNLGSYDNCGIASIQLRRMHTRNTTDCELLDESDWYWSNWGPYVQFDCCDAGQYVMVEMRVTDIHGNENVCWLNVLVEDKTVPTCVAPAPVTVACDALPAGFDPYNTAQLTQLFGTAQVTDNCSAFAEEFAPIVNLDSCGFGTIIRRFRAVDLVGNISPGNFQQIVTITNVTHYAIRFPADVETDCIQNVDTTRVYEIGCDRITTTHRDTILPAVGQECYIVRRTYDVINWCEWNGVSAPVLISRDENCDLIAGNEAVWVLRRPDTTFIDRDSLEHNLVPLAGTKGTICDGTTNPDGYWRTEQSNGYWRYVQFIKVYDTIQPVIVFTQPEPFCTVDATCETQVTYPFTLTENCDFDTARIVILLDADANGTIDADLTNTGVLHGTYPNYTIQGVFPIGDHNFVVTAIDRCGNSVTTNLPFSVVDCYVVDPICYNGLIVHLAPVVPAVDLDGDGDLDAAGVQIFANELGLCSLEDCNGPVTLSINRVGETPNREQTSLWLTCDDRYSLLVEIYVWDSAFNPYAVQPDGTIGGPNYKYCTAMVFVQDPNYLCPNCEDSNLDVELAGHILTEENKPVENVTLTLAGPVTMVEITDNEGTYGFENVPIHHNYTVTPVKDHDHLNGVTTLDVILIQRHLLGIQPFDSPYKLIAADANNSGAITTLDMIEIRRLVLGDIDHFSSNTSWRFVERNYEFPVQTNPWFEDFPEMTVKNNLTACDFAVDYIAVKIGDVNLTANPNSLTDIEERGSGAVFGLRVQDLAMNAGETYQVDFRAADLARIHGYQFTLEFDMDALGLEEVQYNVLKEQHIGLRRTDRGALTFSWDRKAGDAIPGADEVLFSIVFRAQEKVRLREALRVTSQYTKAEAYDRNDRLMDVILEFVPLPATTEGFELMQNRPNPFADFTVIGFRLPETGPATLHIQDAAGKMVRIVRGEYGAGYNEVRIERDELPASGVYYYTLKANGFIATKKMVITE